MHLLEMEETLRDPLGKSILQVTRTWNRLVQALVSYLVEQSVSSEPLFRRLPKIHLCIRVPNFCNAQQRPLESKERNSLSISMLIVVLFLTTRTGG